MICVLLSLKMFVAAILTMWPPCLHLLFLIIVGSLSVTAFVCLNIERRIVPPVPPFHPLVNNFINKITYVCMCIYNHNFQTHPHIISLLSMYIYILLVYYMYINIYIYTCISLNRPAHHHQSCGGSTRTAWPAPLGATGPCTPTPLCVRKRTSLRRVGDWTEIGAKFRWRFH